MEATSFLQNSTQLQAPGQERGIAQERNMWSAVPQWLHHSHEADNRICKQPLKCYDYTRRSAEASLNVQKLHNWNEAVLFVSTGDEDQEAEIQFWWYFPTHVANGMGYREAVAKWLKMSQTSEKYFQVSPTQYLIQQMCISVSELTGYIYYWCRPPWCFFTLTHFQVLNIWIKN